MTIIQTFTHAAILQHDTKLTSFKLKSLVENLDDGIVMYDQQFTVLSFNHAAETTFRLSSQEVVGRALNPGLVKDDKLRILIQTIFPSLAPTITQISETDSWPQILELSFDSPQLTLHTTLHRILGDSGECIGFVKVVRDITREKAVLASKNEFINVTAHQLRTPLTAIHWALQSITKNTPPHSDLEETTKEALAVSERALKIVNDLLDAAKIEDGRFGYAFENTNLTDFIQGIVTDIAPIANQYGIHIEFTKPQETFMVMIDSARLGTAIANIIDNAIKYNVKNGSVTVVITKESQKPFAKITIHDTGVGIPENEAQKIFQKLYRGSNVVQLEPNGSGLGLYITKNIIERHGGEVGFESATNRGTTFWFTLPLDPSLLPVHQNTAPLL